MNRARFTELAQAFGGLRIALIGDYCLDRYLEIDPALAETSLETGLPVHNVTHVRAQPGAAGTILNNLAALGVGEILPVGFCGEDGEGYELQRALRSLPGVSMDFFKPTPLRRTFTYCKPLVLAPGNPPVELSRLDSKNWSPTPAALESALRASARAAAANASAVIVLDQADLAGTGVVTRVMLEELEQLQARRPGLLILADSRRGLRDFPKLTFKMNAAELAALTREPVPQDMNTLAQRASALARANGRSVFISLAERGILGAAPDGDTGHVTALPLRGEIDVVGAGDAVSASLAASLASGAGLREALTIANAAASVVVHKLGTTGTATPAEIAALL